MVGRGRGILCTGLSVDQCNRIGGYPTASRTNPNKIQLAVEKMMLFPILSA